MRFPFGSPPYVRQLEEGLLDVHGLKIATGVGGAPLIAAVVPGSAAAEHGLKAGQRILEINGRPVTSAGEALALLLQTIGMSVRRS